MQQNTELRKSVVSILNRYQFETVYRRQVFIRTHTVHLLARLPLNVEGCGNGTSLSLCGSSVRGTCREGTFTGDSEGYAK